MKTLSTYPSDRYGCTIVVMDALLAVVLHWDSIGMFAELPEVRAETYTIKKTTRVDMVLFPDEEPVIAIDEKPLGEKKIPWTGYGTYQP